MPIVNPITTKLIAMLLGSIIVLTPASWLAKESEKDTVKPTTTTNEKANKTHLYIVVVHDDGEEFQYEFGNLKHAIELFNNEKTAQLIEYKNGSHYLMETK